MSQAKTIVNNIKRHGVVFIDDAVEFFQRKGYMFDQTLFVERVRSINLNPKKYGLPEGWIIGSKPMIVDNKVRRVYCMVDKELYENIDARSSDAKQSMKRFATT